MEITTMGRSQLDVPLSHIGVSSDELQRIATSTILFGSRSIGVESPSSDWDILCIGNGTSKKTRQIDLVWISPRKAESKEWLQSELASHVAKYGMPLFGDDDWRLNVELTDATVGKKADRLTTRINTLAHWWPKLAPIFRRKHLALVQADLLRLDCLIQHQPVPPTPVLHKNWPESFEDLIDGHMKAKVIDRATRKRFHRICKMD